MKPDDVSPMMKRLLSITFGIVVPAAGLQADCNDSAGCLGAQDQLRTSSSDHLDMLNVTYWTPIDASSPSVTGGQGFVQL
ncbi:MAG: hypothetical protein ACOYXM_17790 [Actinomycetota bacterium]